MKITINNFESSIIVKAIAERISNTSDKTQIARLYDLKDKVSSQFFEVKNREQALLRGILNAEVWKIYNDSYLKFMNMSVVEIISLSDSEKRDFNQIEQILTLGNRIWSKDSRKEVLSSKTAMYEFLIKNNDKKWYYSHSNGELYKLAIQINTKEFIQFELKSDSHFPKIKECTIKAELLSVFDIYGNKNNLAKFIQKHKNKNQTYKRQLFIINVLEKNYET